jgi:hypothetical protein
MIGKQTSRSVSGAAPLVFCRFVSSRAVSTIIYLCTVLQSLSQPRGQNAERRMSIRTVIRMIHFMPKMVVANIRQSKETYRSDAY